MEKIKWIEEYNIGILLIDTQHKKLFKLYNNLIEKNDLSVRSAAISDALMKMIQYADFHFKSEEKIMLDAGFKEYKKHKSEHSAFLKKTVKLIEDTIEKKETVPEEIMNFLREWLIEHVIGSDKEIKVFIDKKKRHTKTR